MKKNVVTIAKRKTTIASGVITDGDGKVFVNNKALSSYQDRLFRLVAGEPLVIASDLAGKYNIHITVRGGGSVSRSQAIRAVIAKSLARKEKSLRKRFLEYDRSLLVDDKRQTEAQKPYRSAARALKQTSYR
jgi:small subunit ribosomal protein S9